MPDFVKSSFFILHVAKPCLFTGRVSERNGWSYGFGGCSWYESCRHHGTYSQSYCLRFLHRFITVFRVVAWQNCDFDPTCVIIYLDIYIGHYHVRFHNAIYGHRIFQRPSNTSITTSTTNYYYYIAHHILPK